jgi:hypothetical protein
VHGGIFLVSVLRTSLATSSPKYNGFAAPKTEISPWRPSAYPVTSMTV